MLNSQKKPWPFWAQLVATLAVLEFLFLVTVFPALKLSQKEHYPFSDLGTWLQGVLTPLIVGIALITWLSQQRAQRDEAAAQQATTRLNATALILTHLHQFYGHVNYTAACALTDSRPSRDKIPQGDFQCVNILIDLVRGKGVNAELFSGRPILSRNDVIRSEQFRILKRDMAQILNLLQTAEIAYMTDYRITELRTETDKT
jgi:hypothetical protein